MRENIEYNPNTPEIAERSADYRFEVSKIVRELLASGEYKIGEGKTAEIHESSINPQLCYKVILHSGNYNNTVRKEAELMDSIRNLEGVKVPKVYFSYIAEDDEHIFAPSGVGEVHVLAMEKLEAVSIRDILQGVAEIPEALDDLKKFRSTLRNFITNMHEDKNLFHRDLHEGNIMILKETGNPAVVDFGDATIAYSEEDPYREFDEVRKKMVVYDDDFTNMNNAINRLLAEKNKQIREVAA